MEWRTCLVLPPRDEGLSVFLLKCCPIFSRGRGDLLLVGSGLGTIRNETKSANPDKYCCVMMAVV